MRMLLAALVLGLPALAVAQDRIPENTLREHTESCLATCTETRSYAFCSETCACMSGEMRRHWTVKDYRGRSMTLSEKADDRTVRDELDRMAAHCASKRMQTAQ